MPNVQNGIDHCIFGIDWSMPNVQYLPYRSRSGTEKEKQNYWHWPVNAILEWHWPSHIWHWPVNAILHIWHWPVYAKYAMVNTILHIWHWPVYAKYAMVNAILKWHWPVYAKYAMVNAILHWLWSMPIVQKVNDKNFGLCHLCKKSLTQIVVYAKYAESH